MHFFTSYVVALYYDDAEAVDAQSENTSSAVQPVDQKFLRDYIAYARNNICPEISAEAEAVLVRNYVEMRSLGNGNGKLFATFCPIDDAVCFVCVVCVILFLIFGRMHLAYQCIAQPPFIL